MLKTRDFVELLSAKLGTRTMYGLAKALGKSEPTVRRWWKGHGAFGQHEAIEVARILDLPPEYVIACAEGERASDPEARRIFESIAEHFKSAAAAIVAVALVFGNPGFSSPADAAVSGSSHGRFIHYAKSDAALTAALRRFFDRIRALALKVFRRRVSVRRVRSGILFGAPRWP